MLEQIILEDTVRLPQDWFPIFLQDMLDRGLIEYCDIDTVIINDDGVASECTRPGLKITERGEAMLKEFEQHLDQLRDLRHKKAAGKTVIRAVRRGFLRDIIVAALGGLLVWAFQHFPDVVRDVVGWFSALG